MKMPHISRHIKSGTFFLLALVVVGVYAIGKMRDSRMLESDQSKLRQTINTTGVPPGYSAEKIEVKFRTDVPLESQEAMIPPGLRNVVMRMSPLFGLPKDKLDELIEKGGHSVTVSPDMSRWWTITLKPGTDAVGFVEELRRLDNVENVQFAPLPAPPPAP
jgi:hypothetical protein